jgi:hypothetical protein
VPDKTAAILCAGKSVQAFLDEYPGGCPRTVHDHVIGVNRMAADYPCDFWAFNDHEAFGWWPAIPGPSGKLPTIFTSNQAHSLIGKQEAHRDRRDDYDWLFYPQIQTTCPADAHWTNYSMLVAMVLAQYLGARRIFIYGYDGEGTTDYDGAAERRPGRHLERWKNEAHWFGHVSAWLRRCGVMVTRVGHSDPTDNGDKLMAKMKHDDVSGPAGEQPVIEAAAGGEAVSEAAAYEPVTVSLVMRRPVNIDKICIAGGTVVGEVTLTHPLVCLNYLTRGHVDGLIGELQIHEPV